jgi:hypothetical protein
MYLIQGISLSRQMAIIYITFENQHTKRRVRDYTLGGREQVPHTEYNVANKFFLGKKHEMMGLNRYRARGKFVSMNRASFSVACTRFHLLVDRFMRFEGWTKAKLPARVIPSPISNRIRPDETLASRYEKVFLLATIPEVGPGSQKAAGEEYGMSLV